MEIITISAPYDPKLGDYKGAFVIVSTDDRVYYFDCHGQFIQLRDGHA